MHGHPGVLELGLNDPAEDHIVLRIDEGTWLVDRAASLVPAALVLERVTVFCRILHAWALY